MGENPNFWSNMHDDVAAAYAVGSSIPLISNISQNPEPPPPYSWSQLLFSRAPGEERGLRLDNFQAKKLGTCWEEQVLNPAMSRVHLVEGIKQEGSCLYGNGGGAEEFQGACSAAAANWSHMVVPSVSSSPRSCFTSSMMTSGSNHNNNNTTSLLDSLSCNKKKADTRTNLLPADHHSSECSTASGGISKKARVQASSSSSQPPLKVRKEKLGDRISALHQLVSPFGKTDTASVLLEAIGYIRFLHGQIEALCFPYFGNSSKNLRNNHFANRGEKNSMFPEDPGQLLNIDSSLKTNGAPSQENGEEKAKELRSRGLCLVPMSLSHHLGSDHNNIGPHFWSSTYATGF